MIPRLRPLPAAELEALHEASLELLATVGVRFPSPAALDLLREAGADVDEETLIVRLPRELVEQAVAAAPRDVLLAGRDPGQDARLDGSRAYLSLDGTGAYTLDHTSGERRASTMRDLADATRLADALPEIGVVWNIVSASDADANVQVLQETATVLRNTGKHVQGEVQRAAEVPFVMDMLAAAADDGRWDPRRPIFSIVYCPVPPLTHEPEMLEAAMSLARQGVPMSLYSMGLAGATAPVTLAGAVAQANAEILSSIVLFELIKPGLPLIYCADTGVLDMHSGIYVSSGPEALLITAAMAALARSYDLPLLATGLTSDANEFSFMAGLDAGMTTLVSTLLEPDILVGAGMLDAAQMLSLPKMVLDAEVFRQCLTVAGGMTIDAEHLMTGLVAEVGPGGHFLKARQTRRFLHDAEHHRPALMLREAYELWSAHRQGEYQRAVETVERLLGSHQPKPLPEGCERRFAEIVRAAAAELRER